MKKFLSIILVCVITFSMVSCAEEKVIAVNVENQETLQNTVLGVDALVELGNGLYYDSTTRIVYWWNGIFSMIHSDSNTTPSPYYAPNGLPYRYNPETNTFEEIETGDNSK